MARSARVLWRERNTRERWLRCRSPSRIYQQENQLLRQLPAESSSQARPEHARPPAHRRSISESAPAPLRKHAARKEVLQPVAGALICGSLQLDRLVALRLKWK